MATITGNDSWSHKSQRNQDFPWFPFLLSCISSILASKSGKNTKIVKHKRIFYSASSETFCYTLYLTLSAWRAPEMTLMCIFLSTWRITFPTHTETDLYSGFTHTFIWCSLLKHYQSNTRFLSNSISSNNTTLRFLWQN